MKIAIKIVFPLLLLVGALLYWIYREKAEPALPVHPEVMRAALYADTSSYPTFLQMVDFVKSNPDTPKFIFWRRMTGLNPKDPLLANSYLVSIPKKRFRKVKEWDVVAKELEKFLKAYPNARFILHLNKDQNALVWVFLKTIPRERIEHIHWYEESFAATTFQIGAIRVPEEHALRLLERKEAPPHFGFSYSLSLIPFYSSTVYLGLKDYTLQEYPGIRECLRKAEKIVDVRFEEIAAGLTEMQKQDLLRLAGVNRSDLEPFKSDKPVLLYTLGFFGDDKKFNEAQIRIMERLLAGKIVPLESPDHYTWLFKEHPWLTANTFLKDTLTKRWPFMKSLPKQTPLEVLFLTGYMPDEVFGYSSSLFFALPPERILFYIQRPHDTYVPLLKHAGILTDDKIISLEEK